MASCSSSSSSSVYNNTTNVTSNINSNNNTKIIYAPLPPPPPNSETASEISSVDSDWSDIRAIAFKLGVQNPDDLLTERFKVNRQKLENMIKADGTIEGMNGAEQFFENVMKNTSTYISWPCRLKIGAKTKKDPHVRIVGKPEDVIRAKEQILSNLASRDSHVIMKIDVSYTDHSCIIGRGGNNIKKIMEDTSTHIHFPDSNRSNPTEKSNQVSLCGSLEGVERARSLVRLTTPLLMSFELPIMEPGRPVPDHDTPYIKEIENKYNVQVIFSTRPKLHSSLILVKGSEKEASKVQEATQLLINFTCENIASQILVNMQLEISPQHHEIVKGKNSANLLYIMEKTKTKIIFPDINDMNIKQIKKSQIIISGTIEGVYNARQQLIGNLPITLIFDYPEYLTDPSEITNISYKYGVFITFRQKHKQSTMVAVIKGVEKFIDKIYEARREILRLNTTNTIKPDIPQTYLSPFDHEIEQNYRQNLSTFLANNPESPFTPLLPLTSTNTFQTLLNINSNHNNHNNFISNNNNNNNNLYNHHHHHRHHQQQQHDKYQLTPTGIGLMPNPKQLILPPNIVCRLPSNNNVNVNVNNNTNNNNNNNHQNLINSNINNIISSSINNNNNNSTTMNIMMNTSKNSSCLSPRNSSNNTSGYQSFSSSTNSLEQSYLPYNINTNTNTNNNNNNNNSITTTTNTTNHNNSNNNNLPSSASKIHYSPDSTLNNDITIRGRRMSDGNLMHNLITSENNNNNEYRNLHSYDTKQNLSFDYDLKRVYGYKAMERQPQGELRTPNSNWIGLGLSNTSPAPLETVDDMTWNYQSNSIQNLNNVNGNGNGNGNGSYNNNNNNNNCNQLSSPYHMGITSIIDSISINRHQRLSQHKDIHSLLTSIGLEHYIKTFVLNEIDLEVFTTLTEDNLIELGITAFGARKKILIAIHSLLAESLSAASSSNSACQSIIATAVSAAATSTTLATGSAAAAAASSSSSSTSANICSLPSHHRQNVSPRFSGSAAPGAERRTSNKW